METVQAPVLKGALMIAMLHVLLLVLMIANILALLLFPYIKERAKSMKKSSKIALAGAKEPVQVDVVVLVIIHAAFLVKLHVITIVLLFVLYLLYTVETQKRVY